MCKTGRFLSLLSFALCNLFAQDAAQQGITAYARFEGSHSSLGTVTKLDTNLGYHLNSHLWVSAGLPFYFVAASGTSTSSGSQSGAGIGNAYAQLQVTGETGNLGVASTVTVTAPTGNKDRGFSTGRVTADWSNYFFGRAGRITPFAEIGIANSVSDTRFFVRPYSTRGFVAHGQGGVRVQLAGPVSAGGAFYVVLPSGQQTVVSRVVKGQQQTQSQMQTQTQTQTVPVQAGKSGQSMTTRGKPVLDTTPVTTGSSDLARDNGASVWVSVAASPAVEFYGGYTRSVPFDLNTVSFGVGVSVGKLFRTGE